MSEEQKKLLETQLWNIANILRGKINANQFQDYVLGFIFYKYLSEKMQKHADKTLGAVKANDYDLNIPRYVNMYEEAESIDIGAVVLQLNLLNNYVATHAELVF